MIRPWKKAVSILTAAATILGVAGMFPGMKAETVRADGKKKVVAYVSDRHIDIADSIDYDKLTHINISFLRWNSSDGFYTNMSSSNWKKILDNAHAHNVKVILSLGGSSFQATETQFKDSSFRAKLLQALKDYSDLKDVSGYELDGIDIDIEKTSSGIWSNLADVLEPLASYLHSKGKVLTTGTADYISKAACKNYPGGQSAYYANYDFVNIMTYDEHDDGSGPVATAEGIQKQLNYFYGTLGLSKNDITVGVPFYGYQNGTETEFSYKQILYGGNGIKGMISDGVYDASSDYYSKEKIYFNGINTIKQTTSTAIGYGGVMIWELSQDSSQKPLDQYSLLRAISDVYTQNGVQLDKDGQGNTPTNTPAPTATTKPTVTPTPIDTNDLPVLYGTFPTYTEDSDNTTKDYSTGDRVLYNGIIYEALLDIYVASSNTINRTDRFIPVGRYGGSSAATNTPTPTKKATNTPTPTKKATNTPTPTNGGSSGSVSGSVWAEGASYSVGDIVVYNGKVYECIVNHTSISTWTPDVPTLWKERTDLTPADVNTGGDPTPTPTKAATATPTATKAPTATPTATKAPTATPTNAPAENGWKQVDGTWYYYKNGAAVTGWFKSAGKWYFFDNNGAMKTGWVRDGGKWYYLDRNGAMKTGWVSIDGKWYYLESSGALSSNKWVKSGSDWYHTDANGIMMTSKWQKSGGAWYYFGTDGKMVKDCTLKIGGVYYTFDTEGVWQG